MCKMKIEEGSEQNPGRHQALRMSQIVMVVTRICIISKYCALPSHTERLHIKTGEIQLRSEVNSTVLA